MVLILILVFLCLMLYAKISTNKDTVKQACKTEQDKANVKNARKVYSTTKEAKILVAASVISLIAVILMRTTNIIYIVKDYVSADLVDENQSISIYCYLIPVYILVCRQIVVEVKISEFLYKFFNVEEQVLEENPLKNLLYKKAPVKKAPIKPAPVAPVKEEPKPNIITEQSTENKPVDIELPTEKKEV